MSLRAKKKARSEKASGPKQPWRDNIESLAVAIIVALILKAFVIEVSKIPSGSMQPTLQGNPVAGVFDRILVDKLSFSFRAPHRFEVVVFRHPLERSRNMVKRLAGVGPEWLRIAGGDLWSRPDEDSPWEVVRRPRTVEKETWRLIPPRSEVLSDWEIAEAAHGWIARPGRIEARGDGSAHFRPDDESVHDGYLDGYHAGIREVMKRVELPPHLKVQDPVGDLRVDLEVEALPGCVEVAIELSEGPATYRFVLPGPDAPPDAGPSIEVREGDGTERSVAPEDADWRGFRLEAGDAVSVRAQNLDDRLELCVDGEWILAADVEAVANPRSHLSVTAVGAGVDLDDVEVRRDIHYVVAEGGTGEAWIPDGHVFVLGDNTRDSADSREWEVVSVSLPGGEDGAREVQGNFRAMGENPTNPVEHDGRRVRLFRDRWGERHVVDADAPGLLDPEPFWLVPLELVKGRAFAVFWPLQPSKKLWRLTWIR